ATSWAAIACHGVASLAGPGFAAAAIGRLLRLPVPADQRDPDEQQHEVDEELRPHHGQEAPLLDLPLLLDQGFPARFLQPDEPQVPRFVDLLAVLLEEDRSARRGQAADK